MSSFDLEAAMRGEPFEYKGILDDEWRIASLIGVDKKGDIHGEFLYADSTMWTHFSVPRDKLESLRMVPKPKRTVFINVYDGPAWSSWGVLEAGAFLTEDSALTNADGNESRLLAKAVPIEIDY